MVSIDLPNVATTELQRGINQSGFASLADVDVTTGQVHKMRWKGSIRRLKRLRWLGVRCFPEEHPESNLTVSDLHRDLTAAESSIRDGYCGGTGPSRNQIMTQSATAQLAQANALPKNDVTAR